MNLRPPSGPLSIAALSVTGLVLAGCGSSHVSAGGPTTTTPPTTAASTATTSPSTAAGAGGPTTTSTGNPAGATTTITRSSGPGECTTAHLTGSITSSEGAAGTIYYQLQLRNTGSASCFVQGYPGVQFLAAGDGRPDGAPAQRVAGAAPQVVLGPGNSAYATLGVAEAVNFDNGCLLTTEEGFRVFPPDQTAGLYVAHHDQGCGNAKDQTLSIRPLQASPTP